MRSLVRCCPAGAALGLLAFIVSACGNTSVTCEDLVTCPPAPNEAGSAADSSVVDRVETSVIRDAGAEDTSVSEAASEAGVQVEASPEADAATGFDAEAAAEAEAAGEA